MERAFSRLACRWAFAAALAAAVVGMPTASRAEPTNTGADIAPADCVFFASTTRLREQFDLVAKSKAWAKIKQSGPAQKAWAQMSEERQFQQFLDVLRSPEAEAPLAILESAFADEVFVYGDGAFLELLRAFEDLNFDSSMESLASLLTRKEPNMALAFAKMVRKHPDLRLPTTVIGFGFKEWDRLEQYLEMAVELVKQGPVPVEHEIEETADGKHHVFSLEYDADVFQGEKMREEMERAGLPEDEIDAVFEWLEKQQITVTVGMHGKYLIVAIAGDDEHLEKLGKNTLANGPAFDPLRKHMEGKVIGLSYLAKEVMDGQRNVAKQFDAFSKMLDLGAAVLPPPLVERLRDDLNELKTDVGKVVPKPSAIVSLCRLNGGLETFTYSQNSAANLEYNKPLTILQRAGRDPAMAFAFGAAVDDASYAVARKWSQRLFSYWTDFAKPLLPIPEDQKEKIEEGEKSLLKFFTAVDKATVELLEPGMGSGQSLLLVDARAKFEGLPIVLQLPKPMPMAEVGSARNIANGEKVVAAMTAYFDAIDALIVDVAELYPELKIPEGFRLPRPVEVPYGEGNMYFYPISAVLGKSLMPHAVVGEKLLILSTSDTLTKRMMRAGEPVSDKKVALMEPSGSVVLLRPAVFFDAVKQWIDFGLEHPEGPAKEMKEEDLAALKESIEIGFEVFGCYKGSASRTFHEGDWTVTHGWDQFEDLP